MFNNFKPASQPQRPIQQKENCKIKIKNTAQGKTISFEGNCSKEQIQMAKMNFDAEESEEE
jgi:hypothetical protein